MAEVVIQQLRAAGTPTNPPPQFRAASQKQVTEGGAFKSLTKYTGNTSEYHDWSFSARRVLTRADERFGGLLQWISGQVDDVKEMCLSTGERRTSVQLTWNGSTWNCTRCWPSRHPTRHWHPSSRSRKLKSKGSSAGTGSPTSRGASHGVGDAPRKSAEGHRPPTGILSMGKQV